MRVQVEALSAASEPRAEILSTAKDLALSEREPAAEILSAAKDHQAIMGVSEPRSNERDLAALTGALQRAGWLLRGH